MGPGIKLEQGACAFASGFSEVASEVADGFFWSFCIFLSIICTNCTYTQLFLVPYDFFVFCCWNRHLSRCKHCSKGFQVPACLVMTQKVFLMDTTTNAEQTGHYFVSIALQGSGGSQYAPVSDANSPHAILPPSRKKQEEEGSYDQNGQNSIQKKVIFIRT